MHPVPRSGFNVKSMTDDPFPEVCTLPTTERPLRLAEFETLVAGALQAQDRTGRTTLRWRFDRAAEAAVRDLAARESACCSFFGFGIVAGGADAELEPGLIVEVCVPVEQVAVLDALERLGVRQ